MANAATAAAPAPTPSRGEFRCYLRGFQAKLCNNLYFMWQSTQLCDLTLKLSGDETIRVHSVVLAAFSPTVADILSNVDNHFTEKGEFSQKYVTIDVQKFSSQVMRIIVSAVYTGRLVIPNREIMVELLDACRWLRMGDLVALLEKAVKDRTRRAAEQGKSDTYPGAGKFVPFGEDVESPDEGDMDGDIENFFDEPNEPPPPPPPKSTSKRGKTDESGNKRGKTDESGNKRKSGRPKKRVCSSRENVQFDDSASSKISGEADMNSSGVSNPDGSPDDKTGNGTRKGTRQRKKSHQWMEHFFSNCLYSDEKTFIEAVVPHIKTEVNDLASYIQSSSSTADPSKQAIKKRPIDDDDDSLEADQDLGVVFDSSSNNNNNNNRSADGSGPSSAPYISDSLSMVKFYDQSYQDDEEGHDKEAAAEDDGKKKRKSSRKAKKTKIRKAKAPINYKDSEDEDDLLSLDNEVEEPPVKKRKSKVGKNKDDGDAVHSKVRTAKVKKTKPGRPAKVVIRLADGEKPKPKKRGPKKRIKIGMVSGAKNKMKLSTRVQSVIDKAFDDLTASASAREAQAEEQTVEQIEMDNIRKFENSEVESVKCVRCGVWHHEVEEYKKHVANHPVFSCPDCPAKFYLKRPLTSHRYATHLDPSYLHCKECEFQAKTAKDLCIHSETVHFQPRPFKCEHPGCPFRGKKYSDVQRHFKQIHSTELEFFCEKCGAGFTYKSLYMYHVERCLKKDSHLCYRCGAVFHAKYDLTNHISAVHFKIKKYKCPQCDHRFASHGNLKRHLHVHNNVYPYTCTHCQQKFRHSNTYKMHLESKHNETRPSTYSRQSHKNAHKQLELAQQQIQQQQQQQQQQHNQHQHQQHQHHHLHHNNNSNSSNHNNNSNILNPDASSLASASAVAAAAAAAAASSLPNPYRMHMDNRHHMDTKPPVMPSAANYHHDDPSNSNSTSTNPLPNNYYNNYDNYMHRNTGAEEAVAAAMLTCLVPQWYTQM